MSQFLSSVCCISKGPFISCKPGNRRTPDYWQGIPSRLQIVSILAQKNRPVLKVSGGTSSSLTASPQAVCTKRDVEHLNHMGCDVPLQEKADEGGHICEKEKLRRQRISVANKGRAPWNKGSKHSPQTIQRIKEKTLQAMNSPKVIAKLRRNARHAQTDETRLKIRDKLREKWGMKKRIRGYQEAMVKDWRHCVAEAARKGSLGDEELEWDSYFIIKKRMHVEAAALYRLGRSRKKKERPPSTRSGKSEEHRRKISAAIRAKWEDPEYQSRVRHGMIKGGGASRPRRTVTTQRKRSSGELSSGERSSGEQSGDAAIRSGIGVVVGPLDQSFITAVMSDEKRSRQRSLAAKQRSSDVSSESPSKTSRRTHKRVNLLKRTFSPLKEVEESVIKGDVGSTGVLSFSAEDSLVDALSSEKLHRLKLIQVRCSVIDQRRREATLRARTLMAEAEKAVKELEEAAGDDEFVSASVTETRKIIAEAADFIRAAESMKIACSSLCVDERECQDWASQRYYNEGKSREL